MEEGSVKYKLFHNKIVIVLVIIGAILEFSRFFLYRIYCFLREDYFSGSYCPTWWIFKYDLIFGVIALIIIGIIALYYKIKD